MPCSRSMLIIYFIYSSGICMLTLILAVFKVCSFELQKAVTSRVRMHHLSLSHPGCLFLLYTEALTNISFEKGVLRHWKN